MARSDIEAPWWLGGEERCPACLQRYVYEMEVRCVACDGPLCPLCVVTLRERHERVCADCAPAGAHEEG